MMDDTLLVSVSLLTYNHEDYIRQCLDGILMQKVDFRYEVVVGDDCSTDKTREILKEYSDLYPDIFKLILREKNIGVTSNLYDVLLHCKGRYIAGLEGDDYWLDENKLQIQVDFLEKHHEYIGCGHEVKMIDELGDEWYYSNRFFEGCHWTFNKEVYQFEDFEKFDLPGQGSTFLYRNIFLNPAHDYSIIRTASPAVGDMTLLMLTADQGDWYFMKGVTMTCYRFVTTLGKENWASWIRTRNRCYIDFKFRDNLERYAREVLKRKCDLSDQKYEMFFGATEWCRREGGKDNWKVLLSILKEAKPLRYYLGREFKRMIKATLFMPTVAYSIMTGDIYTEEPLLKQSSWRNFRKDAKGKTVVAFGCGSGFSDFLNKHGDKYKIAVVMDNMGKIEHGEYLHYKRRRDFFSDKYEYAEILSPYIVKEWNPDRFVVLITSVLYQEDMAKQLREMGFYRYYSLGSMEIKRKIYRLFWKDLKKKGTK